ncbi:DNA repair protein [Flavobacterium noncentrifugens]|uniref:DNA repair protein radc n=1 Tax=Flavobacterium noncentrifugens TaxID=1128970 RepID=A0A1G8TD38_9FLAO|nr:JAB domain-containing protein [Flavobacterium noncentrifugens]GEP50183.1 DNA repair protein [Flavobacterium noncentrifugens]SDJ39522.1 DNA repair protein radc [Flavobacterium noncentrifugens]
MNKISEIKVTYNVANTQREKITSGEKAFEVLLNSWDKDTLELQEEFKILLLNRANEVLGIYQMSKGGITGTVVDVRLIFSVALKCNATGIILAHNHPSGTLNPSDADIALTKKIKKCSEFMDIALLDHLIVTKYNFYSFANEGLLS